MAMTKEERLRRMKEGREARATCRLQPPRGLTEFDVRICGVGSGTNAKVEVLKQCDYNPWIKKALLYAVSPYITFGVIPTADYAPLPNAEPPEKKLRWLFAILDKLATRKITGNDARTMCDVLCGDPDVGYFAWRILCKDWRAGIGAKLINKAIPGLIPEFNIALADKDPNKVQFPLTAEPKYDGVRCLIIVDAQGIPRAFSRNGKEYHNFPNTLQAVKSWGGSSFVLDGEIVGATFDDVCRIHRRKAGADDSELMYMVFDFLTLDEFKRQRCELSYADRRMYLESDLELPVAPIFFRKGVKQQHRIMLTDAITLHDDAGVSKAHQHAKTAGLEGLILKDNDAAYPYKRSPAWTKVKDTITVDGKIVDTFEGAGKYVGALGGIVIEYHGHRTKVGSGFSDAERTQLWKRRRKLVGKMAEVEAQEVTKDGALRFPRLVRLRPELD